MYLSDYVHAAANDVTREKDLSKFHRHLLNRLDTGAVEEGKEEERRSSQSTEAQRRRISEEKGGSSQRERERSHRRSESDGGYEEQRERRRSGEERRRSSHRSRDSVSEEENKPATSLTGDGDSKELEQEEAEGDEGRAAEGETVGEGYEQSVSAEVPKLPSELTQEDKEERRKAAAAKRTDSEAQLSAKERYLARKRARTSAPIVAKDD